MSKKILKYRSDEKIWQRNNLEKMCLNYPNSNVFHAGKSVENTCSFDNSLINKGYESQINLYSTWKEFLSYYSNIKKNWNSLVMLGFENVPSNKTSYTETNYFENDLKKTIQELGDQLYTYFKSFLFNNSKIIHFYLN